MNKLNEIVNKLEGLEIRLDLVEDRINSLHPAYHPSPLGKKCGAFDIYKTKIATTLWGKPIWEYDGQAIYDLHVPFTLSHYFNGKLYKYGDVYRALRISDLKRFERENPSFSILNVIQDLNYMSDIYLTN